MACGAARCGGGRAVRDATASRPRESHKPPVSQETWKFPRARKAQKSRKSRISRWTPKTRELCQLKRTYTSTGVLVFPLPSMGGVGALAEGLSLQLAKRAVPQDSDLPLDTYSVLLHSDRVLRNVVRALNLETVLARDNPKAHIDEDGAVKWLSERAAVELLPDRTISIRVVTAGTPQVRKVADLIHREAAWDRDKPARELAVQLVVAMIAQMGVVADAIKLDRSKSRLETLRTMRDQAVTVFDQTREQLAALQQRTGNPDPNTYAQEVTRRLVQASGEWRATQARLQGGERERRSEEH